MAQDIQKIDNKDTRNERVIMPQVDIYETENEYFITTDMPGVSKDNINIIMDNNELTITGTVNDSFKNEENYKYKEFSLYNYKRVFTVGDHIKSDSIEAKLNNGVLNITLPKKEEVKPKKIEISIN